MCKDDVDVGWLQAHESAGKGGSKFYKLMR